MISLYLFLASVSLALLGYGVYQKGKKVVLESMGAIAIIDDESNAILFVSRDTKKKIPHNLDLFNSELDGKLISDYLSLPYQFRGKQCRLLCLSSDNSERPIYNKTDLSLIHTLIQSIPDAIGLTDHEMIYRACNQAFVNPLGIGSPEDLLGKKLEEVASKNISEKFALSDKRVLETGEAFRFIDEVNEPNGRPSWIDAHKFRYINPSTNQYGLFILARDVTEAELVKKELMKRETTIKSSAW